MRASAEGPLPLSPSKQVFAAAVRAFLSSIARMGVKGVDGLPREGPLIVVSNHASNLDGFVVAAWLQPALGRPIRFLGKEQLFRWPLKPLLESFGTILVRAGGSDVDAYRQARAAVARGDVVGIFPEGTRSFDGVLQPAHEGIALLAARSRVPVLPVAVTGTSRLLPRGSFLPRIGSRVTLSVGEPFSLSLDPTMDRRAAVAQATYELMGRIAALLPPDLRGPYAGSPPGPSGRPAGSV